MRPFPVLVRLQFCFKLPNYMPTFAFNSMSRAKAFNFLQYSLHFFNRLSFVAIKHNKYLYKKNVEIVWELMLVQLLFNITKIPCYIINRNYKFSFALLFCAFDSVEHCELLYQ